ncbi:MAG: hypothetical protein K2L39_03830 [Muribaculaceae bacterium]|nr:hypothetical protein [Muribaculaceae bacterium]
MKHFSALLFSVMAVAGSTQAQDFTVLATPEEVYTYSIEEVSGAKADFKAVLDNASATDAEKTAAMQAYQQNATPAPGYAFDMTFLMSYTAVTSDNVGKYTQAKLAETWQNDIDGLTFGSGSVLAAQAPEGKPAYMCLNSAILSNESSYNKFAVYQNVTLSKGSYVLESEAYVTGAAKTANLAAGSAVSADIVGGGVMSDYSVSFKMDNSGDIKLGFLRNSTVGGLSRIYFNNVELYKVSSIIAIKDDATAGLAEATNVDIQLCRDFEAGVYVPICLPFVIENWRDIFDDLQLWNNYADDELTFATISGANTQARKPYLAKTKASISAENYLMFYGVDIQKGNPGSWTKSVAEGEEPFPVKMVGNWETTTVPANCYYLSDGAWVLSDGSATIPAFSAYIDATALDTHPTTLKMNNGSGTASILDSVFTSETPAFSNVYNLQGILLKQNVATESALEDLPAGIYIMNGKKIRKN